MRKKLAIFICVIFFLVPGVVFVAEAEKFTLTVWDWHSPRMDLLKPYLDEYQKLNPNVQFKTLILPWAEFWKKLLVGIAGKIVPDLTMFHNAQTSVFIDHLAPFPSDLFPLDKMRKEYFTFDTSFVFKDQFKFFPGGVMSSVIYYNVDLWKAAGMGVPPRTWAELRDTAKKLTRRDAKGKLEVAGIQFLGDGYLQYIWEDFKYQQGGWIYNEAGTGVEWDTHAGLKPLKFLRGLIFDDKVTEPGFLPFTEAFGTQKAAMVYAWTWFTGWVQFYYPDLKFSVFVLPTETGGDLPARARNNYECDYAVPKAVPEKNKTEVFKLIKWLYDQDEFHIKMNKVLARVPGKLDLWDHPEIKKDSVLSILAKQVPYTIFPGERPSWIDTVLGNMETRIVQGIVPEEALKLAQTEGDREFKEKPTKWIVERQYRPLKK